MTKKPNARDKMKPEQQPMFNIIDPDKNPTPEQIKELNKKIYQFLNMQKPLEKEILDKLGSSSYLYASIQLISGILEPVPEDMKAADTEGAEPAQPDQVAPRDAQPRGPQHAQAGEQEGEGRQVAPEGEGQRRSGGLRDDELDQDA